MRGQCHLDHLPQAFSPLHRPIPKTRPEARQPWATAAIPWCCSIFGSVDPAIAANVPIAAPAPDPETRALQPCRPPHAPCCRHRARGDDSVLFFSVALVLIFLSAVGIYYFEHDNQPELFASVFHSLWWAFVTLTTVGYGDVYPITLKIIYNPRDTALDRSTAAHQLAGWRLGAEPVARRPVSSHGTRSLTVSTMGGLVRAS